MSIFTSLFGSPDPARPLGRNEGQRIRFSDYRKPWYNYWTTEGGPHGFYVVGGPKMHKNPLIMVPNLFPTRAVARSVAKYMTRSARLRVNGTLVA
jgi:hypothetical protein